QQGFVEYPDAKIFEFPGEKSIQHVIFGDVIKPPKNDDGITTKWTKNSVKEVDGHYWLNVKSRREEGWMKLTDIRPDRILEVNFIDIGQGDGCHLVTPDDIHFIIDAGKMDNMYRFLKWRFNLNSPRNSLPEFYAVISHCDNDHWKGFEPLMSNVTKDLKRRIEFKKLYHNGIIQRYGQSLGKNVKVCSFNYLTEFIKAHREIESILKKPGKKSTYEHLLLGTLKNFPKIKYETIWKELNKERILYKDDKLLLEVIAPIPE